MSGMKGSERHVMEESVEIGGGSEEEKADRV